MPDNVRPSPARTPATRPDAPVTKLAKSVISGLLNRRYSTCEAPADAAIGRMTRVTGHSPIGRAPDRWPEDPYSRPNAPRPDRFRRCRTRSLLRTRDPGVRAGGTRGSAYSGPEGSGLRCGLHARRLRADQQPCRLRRRADTRVSP